MADQASSKEDLMDEENEPLIKKAKLSTKPDSETAEGPEGTSLLDTYKINSGGDRMPVELIDSAINVPKSDEKVEPSIDRYFCHPKNSNILSRHFNPNILILKFQNIFLIVNPQKKRPATHRINLLMSRMVLKSLTF